MTSIRLTCGNGICTLLIIGLCFPTCVRPLGTSICARWKPRIHISSSFQGSKSSSFPKRQVVSLVHTAVKSPWLSPTQEEKYTTITTNTRPLRRHVGLVLAKAPKWALSDMAQYCAGDHASPGNRVVKDMIEALGPSGTSGPGLQTTSPRSPNWPKFTIISSGRCVEKNEEFVLWPLILDMSIVKHSNGLESQGMIIDDWMLSPFFCRIGGWIPKWDPSYPSSTRLMKQSRFDGCRFASLLHEPGLKCQATPQGLRCEALVNEYVEL